MRRTSDQSTFNAPTILVVMVGRSHTTLSTFVAIASGFEHSRFCAVSCSRSPPHTGQLARQVGRVCSFHFADDVIHKIHLGYAHMGHAPAQHKIAQRYLQGVGVEKDMKTAVYWLGVRLQPSPQPLGRRRPSKVT